MLTKISRGKMWQRWLGLVAWLTDVGGSGSEAPLGMKILRMVVGIMLSAAILIAAAAANWGVATWSGSSALGSLLSCSSLATVC